MVLLFMHLPKTGGSTLSKYIYTQFDTKSKSASREDNDELKRFYNDGAYHYPIGFFKGPPSETEPYLGCLNHADLRAVLGHFSFGIHKRISSPSTYITIIRHPVDRIISLYYHLYSQQCLRPSMTLERFICDCPADGWDVRLRDWHPVATDSNEEQVRHYTRAIVDNDQTRRIAGIEPGFGDCTEDLLAKAKQNLSRHFSVVGLTERFDESLVLLKKTIGWSKEVNYLPLLVNSSRPRSADIDSRVFAKIVENNNLDMQLYDFASSLLDQQIEKQGPSFLSELESFRQQNEVHKHKHRFASKKMEIG